MGRIADSSYNPSRRYNEAFEADLTRAPDAVFLDNINKKGFAVKGPYRAFDEMTYLDKTDSYVALVPSVNFRIIKRVAASRQEELYYSEQGELMIEGDFTLKVVAPLTGQAPINKRIDLTSLSLSKRYIYETQTSAGEEGGLMTAAVKSALRSSASIANNVNNVTRSLLNEFSARTTEKIIAYLSRKELLSIEKEVMALKAKKSY